MELVGVGYWWAVFGNKIDFSGKLSENEGKIEREKIEKSEIGN